MSTGKGSESAFPVVINLAMDPRLEEEGLTKRELFAAMAMQSLAGAFAELSHAHDARVAEQAVKCADALLAELAKGSE